MTFDVNFSAAFFALLMFFSGGISRADSSTSNYQGTEIAVFTPWSFFQKSLQDALAANTSIEQTLEDQTVSVAGFNFHLSNIQWKLNAGFEQGQLGPSTYDVKSSQLDLTLSVGKINLDQFVEQVVSGVLIRIRIQAECGPVVLHQTSAQAQAQIGFQISSNDLTTQINSFELGWPAQSWQMSSVTCHGPSGFNEVLQTHLNQYLANADLVKPWVQDLIARKIQSEVQGILAKLKTPATLPIDASGLPLHLVFKNFQQTANGVMNFGTLSWSGQENDTNVRPLEASDLPANFTSEAPVLLTKQAALNDLVTAQMDAKPVWTQVDMNKQSGFLRVLGSRLIQLFIWPDLWNYTKASPFYLSVNKPSNVQIEWQSNGSAKVSMDAMAWLQAQRNNQWWPYIRLTGKASGSMTPTIKDGKLSLQAKMKSSGLKTDFGADYVAKFRPVRRLATSLLEDFVNDIGQDLSAELALPVLDLGPMGSFKADSWKNLPQQNLIAVPFKAAGN